MPGGRCSSAAARRAVPASPPDAASAPRRRARISRSGDFDAVYRRGRSAANRHLVVYAFAREDAPADSPARLGLSVSRKVGGAVVRNKFRRLYREAYRLSRDGMPTGMDLVLIPRSAELPALPELIESLQKLLPQAHRKLSKPT